MQRFSSVVLIADASQSALPFWAEIARTIANLIALLPPDSVLGVYLLGTRRRWNGEDWQADMPLPSEAQGSGSFVAPVMKLLRDQREEPRTIFIIGVGPVFDLADWVGNGARWACVRINDESLSETNRYVSEATPDTLGSLLERLPTATPLFRPLRAPDGFVKHRWEMDRAGYPMVYIPPLNAYLHLFPIAKPHYEWFLADTCQAGRGDDWYLELLKLNSRLSPTADSLAEYERLFLTGILPDEVRAYLAWEGEAYNLPTPDQWRQAFQWMKTQDTSIRPTELKLNPVACRLWDGLMAEFRFKTLVDLSLMQNGVLEWVSEPDGGWFGMGQPRESFHPNFHDALRDKPLEPTSLTRRSRLFGLRLMKRVA